MPEHKTSPWKIAIMIAATILALYRISHAFDKPARTSTQKFMDDIDSMQQTPAMQQVRKSITPYTIGALINRSPYSVAQILGEPTDSIRNPRGRMVPVDADQQLFYHGDSIEVLYNGGRATHFDFKHLGAYTWSYPDRVIDLRPGRPDSASDDCQVYLDYQGMKRITFIRDPDLKANSLREVIVEVR